MSVRRIRGGWVVAAAVAGLVSPVILPSSPAEARVVAARDDQVGVFRDSDRTVDVLANDTDSPLNQPITVCAVDVPTQSQSKIYAYIEEDGLRVHLITASDVEGTTATFSYTACEGGTQSTATVTVQFQRLIVPNVRKDKTRKGRIKVTNTNAQIIRFRYGRGSSNVPDGRVEVGSGQTKVITVKGRTIYWAALVADGDGFANAGHGVVEGIEQPRR